MIGQTPEFSVSSFVAIFNQSLDMLYPEVVITGELANFRISKNMWVYFDLKDESASVKFFGTVRALPGPMEDGMLLEVYGRPYLHPQFGFSVQVNSVQAVGVGSLNKAFLLLQKKLEREGLFSPERKRLLPEIPEKIGLIASAESAAFGDFMKIVNTRWPKLDVELFNVQVQGRDAPEQIVRAIEKAGETPGLEVLVVIRGGGSKDDLAAFDHEAVVRAVAGSRLPVLAAIGHERDVALAEMAADMRASTPSNAAEILVPDRKSELEQINSLSVYLDSLVMNYSDQLSREISEYSDAMDMVLADKLSGAKQYADMAGKLVKAYDPRAPLARGYALARSSTGKAIKSAAAAGQENEFSLEFNDGKIDVTTRRK